MNNGTAPPAEIRNEGAEWNRLRERIQSSMEAVERKFNPTELERNANVRGRIVCAIDLDLLLDLPAAESNDRSAVVVLNGAGIETGVLIDAILGVRSIPEGEIRQSLSTLNGIQAEYLKGVTRDNVAVLDVLTILSDPRIRVHEEVD
ncbi:MAG: hypothetical protein DMF61_22985 [Blastocatellia bacterium AA13]|nr:MAG: hypothetical protein DMF61_22985 [Blastocatellia bacterium AA13]